MVLTEKKARRARRVFLKRCADCCRDLLPRPAHSWRAEKHRQSRNVTKLITYDRTYRAVGRSCDSFHFHFFHIRPTDDIAFTMPRRAKRSAATGARRRQAKRRVSSNDRWMHLNAGEVGVRSTLDCWTEKGNHAGWWGTQSLVLFPTLLSTGAKSARRLIFCAVFAPRAALARLARLRRAKLSDVRFFGAPFLKITPRAARQTHTPRPKKKG